MNQEISAVVKNTHPNKRASVSCCLCQNKLTLFCNGAALFQGGTCRWQLPAKHTHHHNESRLSLPSVPPALSVCRLALVSWKGQIRCSVFLDQHHDTVLLKEMLCSSLDICYAPPGHKLDFFFHPPCPANQRRNVNERKYSDSLLK